MALSGFSQKQSDPQNFLEIFPKYVMGNHLTHLIDFIASQNIVWDSLKSNKCKIAIFIFPKYPLILKYFSKFSLPIRWAITKCPIQSLPPLHIMKCTLKYRVNVIVVFWFFPKNSLILKYFSRTHNIGHVGLQCGPNRF